MSDPDTIILAKGVFVRVTPRATTVELWVGGLDKGERMLVCLAKDEAESLDGALQRAIVHLGRNESVSAAPGIYAGSVPPAKGTTDREAPVG